jgi:hypothetical protein
MVRLDAVIRAKHEARGSYNFMVTKADAGGTSSNVQSGRFELAEQGERSVSTIILSLMPGGRYDAQLTLDWDGQSVNCRRSAR